MDNQERTPLQELIEYMDNHSMSGTGTYRKAKSLLPVEKAFMEKVWEGGMARQESISPSILEKPAARSFETYYSKYNK